MKTNHRRAFKARTERKPQYNGVSRLYKRTAHRAARRLERAFLRDCEGGNLDLDRADSVLLPNNNAQSEDKWYHLLD